jgi:hypothetical protein
VALWIALRDRRIPNIDVAVAPGTLPDVIKALKRYQIRAETKFQIDGVTYVVGEGSPGNNWSVESLRCEKPDVVSGSEIAWYDITNGQVRPLVSCSDSAERRRFTDSGLTVLSVPDLPVPSQAELPSSGTTSPDVDGDSITVTVGIPGALRRLHVPPGSDIAYVLIIAGLSAGGYEIRHSGTRVSDLRMVVKNGASILLLRPVGRK